MRTGVYVRVKDLYPELEMPGLMYVRLEDLKEAVLIISINEVIDATAKELMCLLPS
jgi:hypothetical protein